MARSTSKGNKGSGSTETGGTNTTVNSTSTASTSDPGRGRGRGNTTNSKPSQESMGLPNVEAPKIVTVEIPSNEEKAPTEGTKKRGRPKGAASNRKKSVNKSVGGQVDYTHTKILLLTVSGVVASRPGLETFALTNEEAEQIAKPLSNIMAKNESVNSITSEYADHIALLFAVGTIFIGKYLAYRVLNPKPKKKENKKNANPNETRPTNIGDRTNDTNHSNPGTPEGNSSTFNGKLNNLIAPIGGI